MRDVLEATAADLAAAPFDHARWDAALDGMARGGGGWASTLTIVSPTRGYVLDMTPRMPADIIAEAARFGVDPADQPRAHILRAPLMQVRGDGDVASDAERAKSSYYALMRRIDTSYCCMARVDQIGELSVVILAQRHERAGNPDPADRARFAALLPHVRAAARLQLRLEDQGARVALGMMEAVGQAALVCDAMGRIVAMTPSAESALAAGAYVRVRNRRLAGADLLSDTALGAAIARAGAPATFERPAGGRVRLYDRDRRGWIVAETAPIPAETTVFRVQAAVMVLLQLDRLAEDRTARLMRLYGLTAAEAEVALALTQGDTATIIAERRSVRISTVRSQLAAILAKTGTARQAELIALILRTLR